MNCHIILPTGYYIMCVSVSRSNIMSTCYQLVCFTTACFCIFIAKTLYL